MHKDKGIIDTTEIGNSGRLLLSREQSKGVGVDETSGNGGPGFPRHNQSEVASLADGKPIVVVESQLDHGNGVLSVQTGIVEPVLASDVAVALYQPEDGLDGVVQVELEAIRSSDGQTSLQVDGKLLLNLGNQVLVGQLSKSATLISIQENIVDIQKGVQVVGRQGGKSTASGLSLQRDNQASTVVIDIVSNSSHKQILHAAQVELNTDLVVLQSNQGQSQTSVSVEPELERCVVASRQLGILNQLLAREALSNHLFQTSGGIGGQLFPDFQKLSKLLINALSSNQDGDALNDGMSDGVGPVDPSVTVAVSIRVDNGGQIKDKVNLLGQISRSLNNGLQLLSKGSLTLEGNFDGLLGKVGVTSVDSLEEGHLRVGGDVQILCPYGHE